MPSGPPGQPSPGGGSGTTTKPPATTIYQPPTLALGRAGVKLAVRRHDGTALPNVRLLSIEEHEFSPPTARFRYVFDRTTQSASGDPRRIEQVANLDATGPRVVKPDDRIRVLRQVGTRGSKIIFDGFLVAVEPHLSGDSESCAFTCAAAPFREQDKPLPGAIYRDNDGIDAAPGDGTDPTEAQDIQTDAPVQFNPEGRPNAVTELGETDAGLGINPTLHPVFADPSYVGPGAPFGITPRAWTLGMAVRYLMAVGNDETYVRNGDLGKLDELLKAMRPVTEGRAIDPADPDSFTLEDILVPDVECTGMSWPDAVRKLIEPHGFAFRFELSTDATGEPSWGVKFYRKDYGRAARSLYHQRAGSSLVPGRSNVAELSMTRDTAGVENEWVALTEPVRYEASFILEYAGTPDSDDLDHPERFVRGDDTNAAFDPAAYRKFVAGEGGMPRWSRLLGSLVTTPSDLSRLLAPPAPPSGLPPVKSAPTPGTATRTYVRRNREPIGELFSLDDEGNPREAELWISIDYDYVSGDSGLWDPTLKDLLGGPPGGTWRRVAKGCWRLLEDRIGIELTGNDPRAWNIGTPGETPASTAFPGGIVNVPDLLVNGTLPVAGDPSPAKPRFALRLTCVIEGDHVISAVAARRAGSPTSFAIRRYDDSRDRFKKHVVSPLSSIAFGKGLTTDTTSRDDTDAARAHADSRRRSNENGACSVAFTIPYFTDAYKVGDFLDGVTGRGVKFAQNVAVEAGEGPVNPSIVSLTQSFDGDAQTVSGSVRDYRAEPPAGGRELEKTG